MRNSCTIHTADRMSGIPLLRHSCEHACCKSSFCSWFVVFESKRPFHPHIKARIVITGWYSVYTLEVSDTMMLYAEKEKYKSKESYIMVFQLTDRRTVFSFVTVVLFALRSWMMFYLMRLVNTGMYSLVSVAFMLCGITAILFFGTKCTGLLMYSLVVYF